MTSIIDKLDKAISGDLDEEMDGELLIKMFDFITSLDEDQISEDQADLIAEILDMVDPDEEISEVYKRRVRRDLQTARQRRRDYRRHRSQLKIKARKYRRSAKGKQTLRKAKRYAKIGRTSTKRRQRKFVGPQLSKFK